VNAVDLLGEFTHRVSAKPLTSRPFVKAFTSTPKMTADDRRAHKRA
jgi:hypothetical protein